MSEVGFDQLAEEVVTLSGIAVLINPGQDPIAVDPLLAFPAEDSGAPAPSASSRRPAVWYTPVRC